jgi:drug/metabolite transporter (DMT)-like permease
MMATQPMLGLLVNWLIRKVAPPLPSFLFILLSFCGVALVVTKGNPAAILHEPQNFGADALILIGALCWVIYTVGASFFPKWSAYKYTTVTTWLGLTSVFTIDFRVPAEWAIASHRLRASYKPSASNVAYSVLRRLALV